MKPTNRKQYEKKVGISGNAQAAYELAKSIFMQNGFLVKSLDAKSAEVTSRIGLLQKNQNPIHGVSRGELSYRDNHLSLSAELGGLKRLQRFLVWFPVGLMAVLCLIFVLLFRNWQVVWIAGLNLLPWLIISPLVNRYWFHPRTVRALDTLLENAARNVDVRN
ncbi:MAG: hypothetical protein C4527_06925 [Candidatus Omnitrophota bacterium]|jgi:hypothetical protein|nr:MAG: hypothetical protein C4527_06925 [Candidatus Omnitrophota bacterium]